MRLRHQLSAYSPLRVRDLAAASASLFRGAAPLLDELRGRLRAAYAAQDVVLTDSGTHALQLAIELALRDRPRDRPVALPAFTCFDVATAAVAANRPVLLYDLDPVTLGPEPVSLDHAVRSGAGAVVIAPLYGIPVDWDAISAVAAHHDVTLIEDAAQGSGASWRNRPIGTLADISTLSFGRGKGWTGGTGGALLLRGAFGGAQTRDERRARIASDMRNLLALVAQWSLGRPALYALPRSMPWLALGETTYRDPVPVESLPRSAAAAILSSMAEASREAERRRTRAAELRRGLPPNWHGIDVSEDARAGYLRFPVRVTGGMRHFASVTEALALGVAPSYPSPLSHLPALAALLQHKGRFAGASALASDLITLPTHSRVTAGELSRVLSDRI